MAIAASKKTAARGNVSCETAWNDECRCFVFVAHRERRYNPNAAIEPDITQVITPGIRPDEANAYHQKEKISSTSTWSNTKDNKICTRGKVSMPIKTKFVVRKPLICIPTIRNEDTHHFL